MMRELQRQGFCVEVPAASDEDVTRLKELRGWQRKVQNLRKVRSTAAERNKEKLREFQMNRAVTIPRVVDAEVDFFDFD